MHSMGFLWVGHDGLMCVGLAMIRVRNFRKAVRGCPSVEASITDEATEKSGSVFSYT